MLRSLDYFLKETFQSIRKNGLVVFAAVSTAFIALFLVGGALLVNREVGLLIQQTEANVEVSVYLADDISTSQQQSLADAISGMPEVASVRYESKSDAYQNFRRLFSNQSQLIQGISPDALPASFRVKLKDPEQFAVIDARLVGQPGIDKIVDSRETLNRLFAVTRVFRVGVLAVAIVMGISAATLIANTVRMAVYGRRKEIGIMRLVGATSWYIRVPFLIEGVLEGLLGACAAILGLLIMKFAFIDPLHNKVGFLPLIRMGDVIATVPWLLLASVGVSALASLIAMRRFLDV